LRCSSLNDMCGNAAMAHRDDDGGNTGGGWWRGRKDAHRLKHQPPTAGAVSIKHARCSVSYTERIPCPGRISTTPSRFVSGLALAYK
jgi:hypothetical protein